MGVFLPRQPVNGAAVHDQERHFAAANYRTAKGSCALDVGAPLVDFNRWQGRSTADHPN